MRVLLIALMLYWPLRANTPPSLISYTQTAWNVAVATATTASISWNAGDFLVAIGGSESGVTLGVPVGTGLIFTSQKLNATASTCGTRLATASPVSGGSATISMTTSNGGQLFGFGVWVFRNAGGLGNSSEQHTATKTVSLTPAGGADSAIVWGAFDFAAAALQTITPTPTNTRQRAVISTNYTTYVADLTDQAGTGGVGYGISGTGSGPFSIVVMEIEGTAGGGSTPGFNKRHKLDKLFGFYLWPISSAW